MQSGMPTALFPFEPMTPPTMARAMPAITPSTVSSRPRPPPMLCAFISRTCGSGISGASGASPADGWAAVVGWCGSVMVAPVMVS